MSEEKTTHENPIVENENSKADSYEFQSEVKQLLNILIFSLYKHKEVFLRELISNSVDALNKVQFEALSNSDIEDRDLDQRIDISFDEDKNVLIVEDTGIGMTRQEIIDNIGTIAHSGTMDFVKKISESSDNEKDKMDLIGQFGVGFYSSFMVADELHVHTKSYLKGSKGLLWKSKGGTDYTIEEKGKQHRGTRIELFLKEDEKNFAREYTIKNTITQHSRFVPFPIYLKEEKIEMVEAIWTQPKSTLQDEDYNEFFKFFQNSSNEPASYLHLSSDAPVQFNSILYVPDSNPEVYGWVKNDPGVDLYSKKVLIQKSCSELLPVYFRFIKGVVDSEDIPLNISRESIQSNALINTIRKYLLKKTIDHFKKIKTDDREKYLEIWKNFNKNFKEGLPNEYEFKEQLAALMLYHSSKTTRDEYTDLDEYVERMPEDQIEIYYSSGENFESIDMNPGLEVFKKKNLEVLYVDPMDAWAIGHMPQYKNKIFRPVEAAKIKLENEETEKDKKELSDAENFVTYLRAIYDTDIAGVAISERLVDSPCMLVNAPTAPSVPLDQIMRNKRSRSDYTKKVLEVNPENKLIKEMIRIHKEDAGSPKLKDLALQLLDNLIMREGIIENIENIVPRLHEIMYEAAKENK
ncbi:MAG: molecular chaperone HtpG [bacterium]|nr:molecular chaperone HtpG [bacterium]